MLSKLMIMPLLIIALNAAGQNGGAVMRAEPAIVTIDYKQIGSPLPDLRVLAYHDTAQNDTVSGKHISKKERKRRDKDVMSRQATHFITEEDFKTSGNFFIMMFNPTCSHCEDMTALLEKNINLFEKSKILLMASSTMAEYLPAFTKRFQIDNYPNMYIGTDSSGFINNVFLYQSLPQINIYNPSHKLVKIYTGGVPIDSLKQYAQ